MSATTATLRQLFNTAVSALDSFRHYLRPFPRWLAVAATLSTATALAGSAKPAITARQADESWSEARAVVEDWEGARRRAEEPAWKEWLQDRQDTLDVWMARHQDSTKWEAGWSHDGVSPKDGSPLEWTDAIPGKETQFFRSASDPQVPITSKLKRWWVVRFRSRHSEMMVEAARFYRLTGKQEYAAWAASQLSFYARNFTQWQPQKGKARLFGQPLTEASGVARFVTCARLLKDFASREEQQLWRRKLFEPEAQLLMRRANRIHNQSVWMQSTIARIALLEGNVGRWSQALDSPFGIRAQLREGVTADYLWREQSLGYNDYVVSALLDLFTEASLAGRSTELQHEMTIVKNMMVAPLYLRYPDGRLPLPADTSGPAFAPNPTLFRDAYRVFPTAIGMSQIQATRNWSTLLDPPPPDQASVAALPPVTTRNMEATRMALLKEGPWQVFIHYGQLVPSHAQEEALNFSCYYEDTDVSHDTGVVGYGSPLYRGYYTRALNHNVPLVNMEGQQGMDRGELLEFSENPARVSVAQPRYRSDAAARRTIEIKDAALVDTVEIECTSDTPQELGLAIHLQGSIQLTEDFKPAPTFADTRPEAAQQWRNVTMTEAQDIISLKVTYPKVTLGVTIETPGRFKIWHGATPDAPPNRRESLYVETRGSKATFVTTFARSTNEPSLQP